MTYAHRLTIIVPEAEVGSFGAWFRDHIDPSDDGSGWPRLNAGGDPREDATHRWASGAFTREQAQRMADQLAEMAGVTQAARGGEAAWFGSRAAAIQAATGLRVRHDDNAGAWGRFEDELAALDLKRRQPARDSGD